MKNEGWHFQDHCKTLLLSLITIGVVAFTGSSFPSRATANSNQDRVYEAQFSSILPIAVVEVKNLQAEHWLRDLEIHIKNVSVKPVYFFRINVRLPDVDGPIQGKIGFPLMYGRPELAKRGEIASDTDVPLNPGQICILTFRKSIWKGFEHYASQTNLPESKTKRIVLIPQEINCGDGTGFLYDMPFPQKKRNFL